MLAILLPTSSLGKFFILALFLTFTNPSIKTLSNSLQPFVDVKKTNGKFQAYFSGMTDYFGFNLRNNIFKRGSKTEVDCIILTVVPHSKTSSNFNNRQIKLSYFIGIAGFWIHPDFWYSVNGIVLMINFIYHYIMSLKLHRSFMKYWFEMLFASIFYCFNSLYLLQALNYTEDTIFMFMIYSFAIIQCIVIFILYPSKLFYESFNPCSYLYGISSCLFVIMLAGNDYIVWNGINLQSMQLLVGLFIYQITGRHAYGLGGSLAGCIINYLSNR